jgi:hypothetical protein
MMSQGATDPEPDRLTGLLGQLGDDCSHLASQGWEETSLSVEERRKTPFSKRILGMPEVALGLLRRVNAGRGGWALRSEHY